MLKGHAKIELTDVNTGQIETYEEDNLVTNAVPRTLNMLAPFASLSTYKTRLLPIYTKLTSGLLMFQNTLEEDINNMSMPSPSENPIVGYASNVVNSGTDTKRGSANLTETTALDNGYKYVWDFTTSQGNGEISALALTSYLNGTTPYTGASTAESIWDTNNFRLTKSSNYVHLLNISDYNRDDRTWTNMYMQDAVTLIVEKVQMCFNQIWAGGTLGSLRVLESNSVDLSQCGTTLNAKWVWKDGGDGYYYAMYCSGTTLYFARFNKDTFELDADLGKQSITLPYSSYAYINASSSDNYDACIIKDGYLYMCNNYYVQKINLNNISEEIQYVKLSNLGSQNHPVFVNNDLYVGKYIIHDDLSYEYLSNGIDNLAYWYYVDECGVYEMMYGSGDYICCLNNTFMTYLATINNLETSITKTESQTMKITYTLTEE